MQGGCHLNTVIFISPVCFLFCDQNMLWRKARQFIPEDWNFLWRSGSCYITPFSSKSLIRISRSFLWQTCLYGSSISCQRKIIVERIYLWQHECSMYWRDLLVAAGMSSKRSRQLYAFFSSALSLPQLSIHTLVWETVGNLECWYQ